MEDALRASSPETLAASIKILAFVQPEIRRLPIDVFGAEYWLADLSAPAPGDMLSEDERQRASRFVFDIHRRRFETAHAALRIILSAQTGVPAAGIELLIGTYGKPALDARYSCEFNMSHSDALALIGIARHWPEKSELGVDIEELREVKDCMALAAANFTSAERRELADSLPAARSQLFLQGWTRKEACLKALGSGLSIAPSTFHCGLSPHRSMTHIPTPSGPAVVEVECINVADDHIAAVARTQFEI